MHSPHPHHLEQITPFDAFTLTVRFLLELAALAALGWWGVRTGDTALAKIALGAGAPMVAAVVWGLFVAPKATFAVPRAVHVALQVLVLGGAVVALLAMRETAAAGVLAATTVANAAALYALGL